MTDIRSLIARLVPRNWTAEQALQAADLLQHAIDAIWSVHGQEMGRLRLGLARDEPTAPPPSAAAVGRNRRA